MTPTQYNEVNGKLAEYSHLTAELEKMEGEIKRLQLAAAKSLLPEHAELQMKLGDLEKQLRGLAERFQAELFTVAGKRTHATPFGSMKFHRSTSLEFGDEEKLILRIKLACQKEELRAADADTQRYGEHAAMPRFTEAQLIRTHEEPNLEALETLDDDILLGLGVRRLTTDNFKVVPFAMKADKPQKKEAA